MATFKQKLLAKLPSRQEALPVFSTIVFFVFTWTLYRMFYQVPSWLYFMNLWNVLVLIAYVLAFALVESSIMMGFVTLLCLIFPSKIFRANFVPLASSLVTAMAAGAVMVQRRISYVYDLTLRQSVIYPALILAAMLLIIVLLSLIFNRFKRFARLVSAVADRMIIFSFIYVPLSLISLVVVIIRNIF